MSTFLSRVAVWERQDGTISVTNFDSRDMREGESEDQFIERLTTFIRNTNPLFSGLTFTIISKDKVPTDRKDREEWSLIGGKVQVDTAKVAAKESKKSAKQAVLSKLKITEEEFKELIRG